jgi:protein O-mannosyl-transferase
MNTGLQVVGAQLRDLCSWFERPTQKKTGRILGLQPVVGKEDRMIRKNLPYYLAAAIALVTGLVYLATLQNDFIEWDDGRYIVDNLYIRSFDPVFFKWAFFDFYAGNWHPLTWISHAVDYAIWGLNPLGHHLTNVILHSANTFVVVVLMIGLLEGLKRTTTNDVPRQFFNTRELLIAAGATGLLFGLHPLHVESVAWVAERKDLLCGLFFLVSIQAYMQYIKYGGSRMVQGNPALYFFDKRYLLSLCFFAFALMSKPMVVTLPVVLLVLDWYPFNRIRSLKTLWAACVEKLPFFILSLLSSILTLLAQRAGGAIGSLEFVPLSTRILVALRAIILYLWKMLVPINLTPFYAYPHDVSLFSPVYLMAITLVAGITVAAVVLAKKQKVWLSAWCYYVVSLIPVLGIIKVGSQSMADRYAYLPSLGPFLVLGLAAARVSKKVSSLDTRGTIRKLSAISITSAIILVLSYATVVQISIWNNTVSLWSYVIDANPDIPIAYNNRGIAYKERGQLDKAFSDFNKAIVLAPSLAHGYNNRGIVYKEAGQYDRALWDYDKAIELDPSYAVAYANKGDVLKDKGQYDRALWNYDKAIELNPLYVEAYNNRGMTLNEIGQREKALWNYDKAVALNPSFFAAYNNRAVIFEEMGQLDRALEEITRAILVNKNHAMLYFNRGSLYSKMGSYELAILDIQRSCQLGNNQACDAVQGMQIGTKGTEKK